MMNVFSGRDWTLGAAACLAGARGFVTIFAVAYLCVNPSSLSRHCDNCVGQLGWLLAEYT